MTTILPTVWSCESIYWGCYWGCEGPLYLAKVQKPWRGFILGGLKLINATVFNPRQPPAAENRTVWRFWNAVKCNENT